MWEKFFYSFFLLYLKAIENLAFFYLDLNQFGMVNLDCKQNEL